MAILKQAAGDRRIFLVASTHEGEDLSVIKRYAGRTMVHTAGPAASQKRRYHRSALPEYTVPPLLPTRRALGQTPATGEVIHIVDTLGEMGSLFAIADVAGVYGRVALPIGGHNPAFEPAQFSLRLSAYASSTKNQAEFDGIRRLAVSPILPTVMSLQMPKAGILTDEAKQTSERDENHMLRALVKRPAIAANYIIKLLNDRKPVTMIKTPSFWNSRGVIF